MCGIDSVILRHDWAIRGLESSRLPLSIVFIPGNHRETLPPSGDVGLTPFFAAIFTSANRVATIHLHTLHKPDRMIDELVG